MATVYGSNAAVYQGRRRVYTPENGVAYEKEWHGTSDKIAAEFDATVALPGAPDIFASLESSEINGRGRLIARYANKGIIGAGVIGTRDDTVEELYAVDVIKDVRQHPQFQAAGLYPLAVDDIRRVETAVSGLKEEDYDGGWTAAMKRLFRMLMHGMDSYLETAFVLRLTVYGARGKNVKASFDSINTVVTPRTLSASMASLIKSLPAGEWLKKPATAEYMGKGRWRVSEEYQWAEKWHAVYGGGLDWGP